MRNANESAHLLRGSRRRLIGSPLGKILAHYNILDQGKCVAQNPIGVLREGHRLRTAFPEPLYLSRLVC
jgi:hypothetical protein